MRDDRTAEDVLKLAEDAERIATALRGIASDMKEGGLPTVLIHGKTALNHYLPTLIEWAEKARVETGTQIRAYKAGLKSKAHDDKRLYEEAAKAKKATKKKS